MTNRYRLRVGLMGACVGVLKNLAFRCFPMRNYAAKFTSVVADGLDPCCS